MLNWRGHDILYEEVNPLKQLLVIYRNKANICRFCKWNVDLGKHKYWLCRNDNPDRRYIICESCVSDGKDFIACGHRDMHVHPMIISIKSEEDYNKDKAKKIKEESKKDK